MADEKLVKALKTVKRSVKTWHQASVGCRGRNTGSIGNTYGCHHVKNKHKVCDWVFCPLDGK